MRGDTRRRLRVIDAPFVALGPSGVAVRDRLKNLTPEDVDVLRLTGEHLGRLASLRFLYDLSGTAQHRDAQIRHAITRLLHWAKSCGVAAIAIEDLDFTAEKTREKHGRKKRFRQLISGIPTGNLKARLISMAAEQDLAIVAVDPAYTSQWGGQYWQKPLATPRRKMSRHDAAGIAIGRRALGYPIRRRTAPPPQHRSDAAGHRTAQADRDSRGREETRPPVTERAHDARARAGNTGTRATSRTSKTVRDIRSDQVWVQDSLVVT